MNSINTIVKKLSRSFGSSEKLLNNILKGPYVYGFVVLIIGIYGPRLSPRLPRSVRDLFNNGFFRFVVLTLVVYLTNKNLYLALTVSIAFILLLNLANSLEVEEHFVKKYAENFSEYRTVLTETFEGEQEAPKEKTDEKTDKKTDKKTDEKTEDKKVGTKTKNNAAESTGDFGSASYKKGYSDGQKAQCPIGHTGGAAYSELDSGTE